MKKDLDIGFTLNYFQGNPTYQINQRKPQSLFMGAFGTGMDAKEQYYQKLIQNFGFKSSKIMLSVIKRITRFSGRYYGEYI